jgi:hypothetical protein
MGEIVNRTLKSLLFSLAIFCKYIVEVHGDAPQIYGIISQESENYRDDTGTLLLYPNIPQKLLLFGGNFSNVEEGPPQIAFTSVDDPNGKCDDYDRTKTFDLVTENR